MSVDFLLALGGISRTPLGSQLLNSKIASFKIKAVGGWAQCPCQARGILASFSTFVTSTILLSTFDGKALSQVVKLSGQRNSEVFFALQTLACQAGG